MTDGSHTKIVGIEFLRFVCAFAVLLWHYRNFAFSSNGIYIEANLQPWYPLLKRFFDHGAIGVQVFWCISGFIFFFRYFAGLSRGETKFREFFVNRLSRLYPLHALTLIVVALLQLVYRTQNGYDFVYRFNDLKHSILNVFFASDWWRDNNFSFNGPIWSVSVEIIVYFIFFAVVSRLKLGWAYASSILAAVIARLLGWRDLSECLVYFFAGGAIAICRFFPSDVFRKPIFQRIAFGFLGFLLSALAIVTLFVHKPSSFTFQMSRICTVGCAVYLFVLSNRWFLLASRAGNFLGNLTYSSYLIHFPVQLIFVIAIRALGFRVEYTNPMLLFGFLATTLLVSMIAYQYFEAPAQKAIRERLLRPKGLRVQPPQRLASQAPSEQGAASTARP